MDEQKPTAGSPADLTPKSPETPRTERKLRKSDIFAYGSLALLMLISEIAALLLIGPAVHANLMAFSDPESFLDIVLFIVLLLIFTAILLLLIRKKAHVIISIILAVCIGLVIYYVAYALFFLIPGMPSVLLYVLSVAVAVVAVLILVFRPEWYTIDIFGIVISAGCAVIFGISLSPLLVVILLLLLIIYDYISVNHTKHMLTLANGIMKQKMPIMFLVPRHRGYSYRKSGLSVTGAREERGAFMIGMGDIIMPGILVVSAQVFVEGPAVLGLTVPALGTIVGSIAGVLLLAVPLRKSGKAQAGLPYINGCAVIAFFICCAVTGSWDWLFVSFFN